MGCGASVRSPTPVTPEQMQELCQIGAREMEVLCAISAMNNLAEITIKPPACMTMHRENVRKLREAAVVAKKELGNAPAVVTTQSSQERKKSGMMSRVFGSKAPNDVAPVFSNAPTADAVEEKLQRAADDISQALDELHKPFNEVARDLTATKGSEMLYVYSEYIGDFRWPDPVVMVRGLPPHGPEEYANCPSDGLSSMLTNTAITDLAKRLLPVVQVEIDRHPIARRWDTVIKTSRMAHDLICQHTQLDRFALEKVELNIAVYIVTKMIMSFGELMGNEEGNIRKDPKGRSSLPETFEAVFSGVKLTEVHWQNRTC